MTKNMVNNQNERKKLKSKITECHKNCQVSVAKNRKLTIESNFIEEISIFFCQYFNFVVYFDLICRPGLLVATLLIGLTFFKILTFCYFYFCISSNIKRFQ